MPHFSIDSREIDAIAQRHGFSSAAVQALAAAFANGNCKMAQFSHPELGGMGQWSGGTLMIGDFSNAALKARVQSLCVELSSALQAAGVKEGGKLTGALDTAGVEGGKESSEARSIAELSSSDSASFIRHKTWWPDAFGPPGSAGSQNDVEYAYFKDVNRLAIKTAHAVTIYDTTGYEIFGVSQQQSLEKSLKFECQHGSVQAENLRVIEIQKV